MAQTSASSRSRASAPWLSRSRLPVVLLYSVTLVVSASLVFMVQPMVARFVLPLLGGTPAVWTTAMLFFQTTLLLSYLYAHWSAGRFGVRRQAALHLAVVAAALLLLPIGVPSWDAPGSGSPVLWLLALLLVSVGLPFFVVSATAPLLQSWLAATNHPDAGDPYFLYRASNLGSVAGLISYPLLVEPRLTLDDQALIWSVGFGAFALLLTGCALALWHMRPAPAPARPARTDRPPAERLTVARRLRWIALAFVPSSLMLGTTTALTTNVAPIPLLWVLPLSLYLLSFIVVFSRARTSGLVQRVSRLALPPLLVLLGVIITIGKDEPIWLVGLIYLVTFFVVALVCHGELAGDRPPTDDLTRFYAFLSLGGALGGLFNVVIAPLVFDTLLEVPLVLLLTCLLLPMKPGERWSDQMSYSRHLLPPLALGIATFAALEVVDAKWVVGVVAGLACVAMVRHPPRFGLALGALMCAIWLGALGTWDVIHQDRSFFGVHKVSEKGIMHLLRNGTTVHGAQYSHRAPIAYYHREGPVGDLIKSLPDRSITARSGVVGLGAGTMACHSRPGERWTFFEIDPTVVRIARDPSLFTYLSRCEGRFDVVMGDGRQSLQRQPEGRFGFLVLDAFSSDAIPVHLLTREALEVYRSRLAPRGVLAMHVTNRYLDLEPVVGNLARAAGLTCFAGADLAQTRNLLRYPSLWTVIARRPEDLGKVARDPAWRPCRRDPGERAWTDDYSNVLGRLDLR